MSISLARTPALPLEEVVGRWAHSIGLPTGSLPSRSALARSFRGFPLSTRPPAAPEHLAHWERRHGYALPRALRAWLSISDGFFLSGPVIHPLAAIGPMIPFARIDGLWVQPESWFELGNPGEGETVCIDLAYRWPGGDHPVFASGDDLDASRPRVIESSFEAWLVRVLTSAGRHYWSDPGFVSLGDPWLAHREHAPHPELAPDLVPLASRAVEMASAGRDERSIAVDLQVSRAEIEAILRHAQYAPGRF